jgi:predicted esterase
MAGVHDGQPLLEAGEPLEVAQAAAILVHGRGASPEDILYSLSPALDLPGFAFLAPGATGGAWYPKTFAAPLETNEPWLSSALDRLDHLIARVEQHVPASQVVLLGFSQGACLTLEYAARHARRYGAVVGLSGALIGPPGMPRAYPGSLEGTPVLLSSSDPDPHVSADLVRQAGAVLAELGGDVQVRIYPEMGHTINEDEMVDTRNLMAALLRRKEEVKT